jgi:hypothetical protein
VTESEAAPSSWALFFHVFNQKIFLLNIPV